MFFSLVLSGAGCVGNVFHIKLFCVRDIDIASAYVFDFVIVYLR